MTCCGCADRVAEATTTPDFPIDEPAARAKGMTGLTVSGTAGVVATDATTTGFGTGWMVMRGAGLAAATTAAGGPLAAAGAGRAEATTVGPDAGAFTTGALSVDRTTLAGIIFAVGALAGTAWAVATTVAGAGFATVVIAG